MNIRIKNASIISFDPEHPATMDGVIDMAGDRITRICPSRDAPDPEPNTEIVDAGDRYVLPGLVCAHHHLYSSFARGFAPPGVPAGNFSEILDRLWWPLDRALSLEDIELSARVGLADGLSRGVTCVVDHHESQGVQRGSLDAISKAVRGAGCRAALCLGVSDRDGKAREGLEESEAFLSSLDPEDRHLRGLAGLHAPFTVEDTTLAATADMMRRFGTGLHVHLAEDEADNQVCLKRFGKRPFERLFERGLVGPATLLIHGVHLRPGEFRQIAARKAIVVHNPESNMNNAVGAAPIDTALEQGATVAIGTDGMSSDVIAQARQAFLLRRQVTGDPQAGFLEAWNMLARGNAHLGRVLFDLDLGMLREGGPADVAVFDAIPPTPLNPENAAGHVLFGLSGAFASDVICDGKILRRGGTTLTFDAQTLMQKARARAAELWRRLN